MAPTSADQESQSGVHALSAPASVTAAVRRLLRPLVRLLLDQRITFPLLTGLLKDAYVEVAESDFALEGKQQTTTRVSLLTGIHRKDVKRLRESPPGEDAIPRAASLGAQLVGRWMGAAEYLDAEGQPLALPRLAAASEGPSFESLVASVSTDIRPRAVLDEWLRLEAVHLDEEDRVILNVGAFVPSGGFDERAFFLGRNLRDHIAAGAHNLRGGTPTMPERSVFYDGLTPESLRELGELSERLGMQALQEVNRRAVALQEHDSDAAGACQRMTFGMYFYRDPDADSSDESDDDALMLGEPRDGRLGRGSRNRGHRLRCPRFLGCQPGVPTSASPPPERPGRRDRPSGCGARGDRSPHRAPVAAPIRPPDRW